MGSDIPWGPTELTLKYRHWIAKCKGRLWRGAQDNDSSSYAMDITRLNAFGFRARGMFPDELSKYEVFGAEIIAPCAGEVISAESSLPNRMPLDPYGSNRTGGNHVVLYCEGHSVHLAHMDTGTIVVGVGDRVVAIQSLCRVGDSGNSMEPHLHTSAVQGRHTHFRDAARSPNGVKSIPLLKIPDQGRFVHALKVPLAPAASTVYSIGAERRWPYGDTPTVVVTSRELPSTRKSVEFYSGDLKPAEV